MEKNVFIKKGDIIVFDDRHKLICGDNVDVMKQMQEKSIDVLFTSPPYNDCGTENEDVSNIKGSNTHKKYINVEKHENWFEWMCETIDYGRKIAKKYVLFNIQALSNNRENVYKLIGKYSNCIHDIIIWHKPNGCPTSTPHKISNKYEMVFIIKAIGVDKVDVNDSVYYNVITQNINSNKDYAKIHRALMSENFCQEIINEFLKEEEICLDCFNGLGTTLLSCNKNNVNYIGIELSPFYCQETIKRYLEYELGNRNIKIIRDGEIIFFDEFKEYILNKQFSIFDI